MRYWFARLIWEASATESQAWAHYTTPKTWLLGQRCAMRSWRRGVNEQLRAQRASSYEIRAAYHGRTLATEIASSRAATQRYRTRWGGEASNMGSAAWRRRELARYWRKMGRTDPAEAS